MADTVEETKTSKETKVDLDDPAERDETKREDKESKYLETTQETMAENETKEETGDLDDEQIMSQTMSYCFSEGFSDVFEHFVKRHAPEFFDSIEENQTFQDEHSLKHQEVFTQYLVLYQDTLADWVESLKITQEQFYKAMRSAQQAARSNQSVEEDRLNTSGEGFFIKLLLASAEYECFFEVMQEEARFQLWQQETDAEEKAERQNTKQTKKTKGKK